MNPSHIPTVSNADVGRQIYDLATELFPINRSLTGSGIRESLRILQRHVPFEVHEVPSGTPVFDWTIPDEWSVNDAWIKAPTGEKVVDFQKSNLHLLQYSVPFRGRISLAELKKHLFTIPEKPDWIPYRNSFYQKNWGFCLRHSDYLQLQEGDYEVFIDASLQPGHMTYGEYFIPGELSDEVLIYTHICHPSLANDNSSGMALLAHVAKNLRGQRPRLSHRFVLAPGNIGAIAWLALNESSVSRIKHGLVLACVGGPGPVHYKKSRRGDTVVDRAVAAVLREGGEPYQIRDFSPYGYADRQFCSPGFNLPVGCIMRTPHGEFPEYHTSADDLDYIKPELLADSWSKLAGILFVLDHNRTFQNRNPKCEPRLGKYGLYSSIGGANDKKEWEMALLWALNLSDGFNSLLDIAERSKVRFDLLVSAAAALEKCGLLRSIE